VAKLNQIIAIDKDVRAGSEKELTSIYQVLQKPALLAGIARTYTPKNDEGEKLPDESTKVQVRVSDMLKATAKSLTKLYDCEMTKDVGNCTAFADVVVDGNVIFSQAPVVFLLFLEKKLVDLATHIKKLPTLDTSENWTPDPAQDCYRSGEAQTTKTKKSKVKLVKAEATKEHAAQVDVFDEDVIIGTWTTVKYSGALPQAKASGMLERITALQAAVKFAREEANSQEAQAQYVGKKIFDYLFAE
jgi:hypothetical protein